MINWIKRIANNVKIIIEMDEFSKLCKQQFLEISYNFQLKLEQNKNFQLNIDYIQQNLNRIQYPNTQQILSSIHSKDYDQLFKEYMLFLKWRRSSPDFQNDIYEISQQLSNFIEQLKPTDFSEEDATQASNKIISETNQNMEQIKNKILDAIKNIVNWETPLIRIIPNPVYDTISRKNNYTESTTSAIVEFGTGDMAPNFSYFADEDKIDIDDILEAEDKDFFESNQVQSDYFMLIRELKNPGSTNSAGKNLRLYTARPVKDRALYLNSDSVPSGIFLANNLSHVEGLSVDLPGDERDVWEVHINENYLIMTLNTPSVKYYQTVGNKMVPVNKIRLI